MTLTERMPVDETGREKSRAMYNLEEYISKVVELPADFQVYKNLVIFRSEVVKQTFF